MICRLKVYDPPTAPHWTIDYKLPCTVQSTYIKI